MQRLKKTAIYSLSFLIPVIILILWLYTNSIIGSQRNVVVVSDMYHQYMILFDHLKEILNNGLVSYSFSKAIGGNMIGTIIYYLLSPFNIITLFFNQGDMYYACMIIILLKLGLCGTTMFIFLKNTFKSMSVTALLMFSTCYALMMYNVGYYFNIIWLDGVMLAPLVLLGIDQLINGKKPLLYGITLFLTILINYYIGYIMCLFAVIYFGYKLLLKYKWHDDKHTIIKLSINFFVISLLSGLMAMIILLPMYIELKDTMRTIGSAFKEKLSINSNFVAFISEFFVGISRKKALLNPYSFFLYTGIINFILAVFYFFNNKITKREKILSLIVLGIFIISFMVNYVNYIWHGVAVPNCFNGRYTFLFSFYLIYLGAKAFINLDGVKKLTYFAVAPIFPLVGLDAYLLNFIDIQYVYVSVALYFLYLFILYQINSYNAIFKKKLILMLAAVTIGELFFNAYADLSHYALLKRKMVDGKYDDYSTVVNYIKKNDNSLFYRTFLSNHTTANDPLYYDYYGTEVFLSSNNKKMFGFYSDIGCFTKGGTVLSYSCHNYMIDALLDVKYLGLLESEEEQYKLMHKFDIKDGEYLLYGYDNKTMNVYENPYSLSLGFMVNKDILDLDNQYKNVDQNAMAYQDLIYKLISDKNLNLIKKIDLTKINNNTYNFKNIDTDNLYIAINYKNYDLISDIEIDFNDKWVKDKVYSSKYSVYFKNVFKNNEDVTIKIKKDDATIKTEMVNLYYFDMNAFKKVIDELKQEQMNIIENKENYLKGSINVSSDKTVLFTSIPYEKGWQIIVDKKPVDYYPVLDSFIGLDLTKGQHTIEFKFTSPGIKEGAIISAVFLSLFILYFVYYDKFNKLIFKKHISDN